MNFKQLLVKNTGVQLGAQAVSLLTGLAVNAILSRKLGVEGFGQFNYIFAFYYFFLSLNDFGTNTIVVREVARDRSRAEEIFGTMLLFKTFLAAISMICACIIILMMNFPPELRNALLLFSLILPLTALQLPALIFQVLLKAEYPALIGSISKIIILILLALSGYLGWTLWSIVLVFLSGEACSLAGMLMFSRKFTRPKFYFNIPVSKEILRSSVPLGLAVLFVAVINRVDFLMLERMTNLHQVGFYSAAYKITNLFEMLPLIVMSTVYPIMSRYAKANREALKDLYEKSVLYLGSFGLLTGGIVCMAAPWILSSVFGNQFKESALALRVLVWSSVFLYFAIAGGNLLISLGKEKINLAVTGAAAALNIGLNLLLIPRYGYVGAACATTLTFFFILVSTTVASYKILYSPEKTAAYLNSPA